MNLAPALGISALLPWLLAAQQPAGNAMHYDMPPGWHREQANGGTYLVPDRVPGGLVVIFLGARPLATSFQEGFETDLAGLGRGQRVLFRTPAQLSRGADGVPRMSAQARLQAPSGARSYRFYLAANPAGQLHMAVFMAATEQLYNTHWTSMQQFAAGWRFDGPSGPAAAAPPSTTASTAVGPPPAAVPVRVPAGRLEGIYAGYRYIYATVQGGVVQRQARLDYYTFFADGTVYWGIVPMLGFDMARARGQDPEYAGLYSTSGNKVSVSLGPSNRFVAVLNGSLLQVEDREYRLQGDPAKTPEGILDGVFRREDAQPGEELARRAIHFGRDGTFEDQGIIESITAAEIVNGNPLPQRASGRGWYQLARNTLLLRYADGYEQRLPITIDLPEQSRGAPSKISVNTYSLVLRR
jgi:hypothetical protein